MPTGDFGFVTLYRIVGTDPPTVEDMMSNAALGKEPREDDNPETQRLWSGLSMFDSIDRARRLARRHRWNGDAFIATVRLFRSWFIVERTGKSRGYHTVWGEAHAILEAVTGVEPA